MTGKEFGVTTVQTHRLQLSLGTKSGATSLFLCGDELRKRLEELNEPTPSGSHILEGLLGQSLVRLIPPLRSV